MLLEDTFFFSSPKTPSIAHFLLKPAAKEPTLLAFSREFPGTHMVSLQSNVELGRALCYPGSTRMVTLPGWSALPRPQFPVEMGCWQGRQRMIACYTS